MREIRFKVWDIKRKRMLDRECIVLNDGDYYEDYRDFEDGTALNNIVVMQYTGLDDKNGLEIFEKDIVKIRVDDGFDYIDGTGIVDWHEREREYAVFLKGEPWRRLSIEDEIEVIGNVYQNKGLLEGVVLNIKITKVEFLTDGDYAEGLTIETDGLKLEFEDSPPEDNTLKRNFKDIYKIEDLIKKAYLAGKNGEELKLIENTILTEEEAIKNNIIY